MKKIFVSVLFLLPFFAGCASNDKCASCADAMDDPGQIPDVIEEIKMNFSQEEKKFWEDFNAFLKKSEDLDYEGLKELFYKEKNYVASPSFDPAGAEYFDLVDGKFDLTEKEKGLFGKNGAYGYDDIFTKDLPVIVTTDSIMESVHKSYDIILKDIEESFLIPLLGVILEQSHAKIEAFDGSEGGAPEEALHDMDVFFTVARSLLDGGKKESLTGADETVSVVLKAVEAEQIAVLDLFGRPQKLDFSQFKPRGHYTKSDELKRYFKAMIWLGRTEFQIDKYMRDLLDSYLIYRLVADSGSLPLWKKFNDVIEVMIGKSDSMNMPGMEEFIEEAGIKDFADITGDFEALSAKIQEGDYGKQLICSQIIATDPYSSEPTPLPRVFLFMGQRFTVDSYVFSNVVYDRIVFKGSKQMRMMPSPLDAWFVLGNQETLPLLEGEIGMWNYGKNLAVLRFLTDQYDSSFWDSSMYNVWLDALRLLDEDTTAGDYPQAMKTLSWQEKMLNAQLASWAELRHDTILYVKQSYTGEVCEYPDAYVEPYPAFFERLEKYAVKSEEAFKGLDISIEGGKNWVKENIIAYFKNLDGVMAKLKVIAQKEVAGEGLSQEETAFLKEANKKYNMCGSPPFSGWYPSLFYSANSDTSVFEYDPTIADVHTDTNSQQILHVGTGMANLMVIAVDTKCAKKVYAGPVFSYYEYVTENMQRLTDEEWLTMTLAKDPARPWWTADFIAGPE